MSGGKRRADAGDLELLDDGEKLRRVSHTLANATRVGAMFVSGYRDEFPLPGLALAGERGQLHMPLEPHDIKRIKAKTEGRDKVWKVDGAELELRNPRWNAFLEDRVTVEAGERLEVERQQQKCSFGALIVTLPGSFEGGEAKTRSREASKQETFDDHTTTWRPGAREYPYDLTYAAFYDQCAPEFEPVTTGNALLLVYDLVTTTPDDVPLVAGPTRIQEAAGEALFAYFTPVPLSLTKRLRLGPDTWRAINDFAIERHFVHFVGADTMESLRPDDLKVAQTLEAFYQSFDEMCITLKAPWRKVGESDTFAYPPVNVNRLDALVPSERIQELPFQGPNELTTREDLEILHDRNGSMFRAVMCYSHALVVIPVSVERKQIAMLPISDVIARLRGLLTTSREDARQYARRIITYRISDRVLHQVESAWTEFFNVLVELNDRPLFDELLRTVNFGSGNCGRPLRECFLHFGWNNCLNALVQRVLSIKTSGGRVRFVAAVVCDGLDVASISPVLDALFSLPPWTGSEDNRLNNCAFEKDAPSIVDTNDLLSLLYPLSPQKFMQLAKVPRAWEMVHTVLPGLVHFVYENQGHEPAQLRSLLAVCDHMEKMAHEVHNVQFSRVELPPHCRKCSRLQSFFSSLAVETTMQFTGSSQREHVEEIVKHANRQMTDTVKIDAGGASVLRLTKVRTPDGDGLFYALKNEADYIRNTVKREERRAAVHRN